MITEIVKSQEDAFLKVHMIAEILDIKIESQPQHEEPEKQEVHH